MSADSYRELAKRGPHDLVRRDPMTLRWQRPGQFTTILAEPGTAPRLNELYTPKPYVYRGTGYDTLTAWMDDEPETFAPGRPASQPCGTRAAYRRHLRHDERPCEDCLQAERLGKAMGRPA